MRQGRWDILRGSPPYRDERRGVELGGAFNNHNVEKLGVTLDLRTAAGRDLLRRLVAVSDVVTENFAAGVFAKLGFSYAELRSVKEDIIYVSNSGFGHSGPYAGFKTFGPVVQAVCGLTFGVVAPDAAPAGWGFSYMDHLGADVMVLAILAAVVHRNRTGEGQWVDMSCTDAGLALTGPDLLDHTVNDRALRRPRMPDSNHSDQPLMAPHGIYPTRHADRWVAIACRDDDDWAAFATVCGEPWTEDRRFRHSSGRLDHQNELDGRVSGWTSSMGRHETASRLMAAGVPASAVAMSEDRIEEDPDNAEWGLFPWSEHPVIGRVRVDGLPAHLSGTDWRIERGAPLLGQHNRGFSAAGRE